MLILSPFSSQKPPNSETLSDSGLVPKIFPGCLCVGVQSPWSSQISLVCQGQAVDLEGNHRPYSGGSGLKEAPEKQLPGQRKAPSALPKTLFKSSSPSWNVAEAAW